jgi:hypothetical protein
MWRDRNKGAGSNMKHVYIHTYAAMVTQSVERLSRDWTTEGSVFESRYFQ